MDESFLSTLIDSEARAKAEEATLERRKHLAQRCSKMGIEITETSLGSSTWRAMLIPNGKGHRSVDTPDYQLEELLKSGFEKYQFVGDYNAIWSNTSNYIEAGIKLVYPAKDSLILFYLLRDEEKLDPEKIHFEIKDHKDFPRFEISPPTSDYLALTRDQSHTLKIQTAFPIASDKALELLETISDALFFSIELEKQITLKLSRHWGAESQDPHWTPVKKAEFSAKIPDYSYDKEPISYYWHARNARGMPLLQFLAYYQVVEFYYPAYSTKEAGSQMRKMLKNPLFDINSDVQIAKVLNSIKSTAPKGGFGNEKSQLKATLRECLTSEEIRAFINTESQKNFYTKTYKVISSKPITIQNRDADLIEGTAERIYDIRCKIVHTKSEAEEELKPILPFSEQATQLGHDIELMRFIAQKVLIAGSSKLNAESFGTKTFYTGM